MLRDMRVRFYGALGLFGAWVVFLTVLAFTSGEPPKPRGGATEATPSPSGPAPQPGPLAPG